MHSHDAPDRRTSLRALMYHDVAEDGAADASGFSGPGPARYKVPAAVFAAHLDAIAAVRARPPARLDASPPECGWALTFDDGGASALEIARRLAARGWAGAFFITTGRIGTPGFVTADDLRELERLGQVVGSHSHSHPARMSALGSGEMLAEWRASTLALAEILGHPVTTASVPGGYFSRAVAASAAAAGIRVLCTSEPVTAPRWIDGCTVAGRYAIHRSTTATTAAAAASSAAPWLRQRAGWTTRKVVKRVGGPAYLKARATILARA
jgi:peptidoglycan/xylan/chitin deacetylase (PgdA/CDA1 family)